jgi:hypothetical protein
MKTFLLLAALLSTTALAESGVEEAATFQAWLEQHGKEFGACEPTKEGENYILCDKTAVPAEQIKKLFALKPKDLLTAMQEKGLKVELICAAGKDKAKLGEECLRESTNKMFAEITALHGKYLPRERTILIRNSASPGSLVHEYVHSLQSENGNEIYGKAYKKSRNEIQRKLIAQMDEKIAAIQELEKTGKKEGIQAHLGEFMQASDALRAFAPWQDLIDERGIFLLYLKFGREFGATKDDLALARKNMGFLCKNPKIGTLIPEKQCKL